MSQAKTIKSFIKEKRLTINSLEGLIFLIKSDFGFDIDYTILELEKLLKELKK